MILYKLWSRSWLPTRNMNVSAITTWDYAAMEKRKKPEPLWTAVLGNCRAEGYDFKKLKIRKPKEKKNDDGSVQIGDTGV